MLENGYTVTYRDLPDGWSIAQVAGTGVEIPVEAQGATREEAREMVTRALMGMLEARGELKKAA